MENPGLVVIDEQHKFGVAQRGRLTTQDPAPDVLVMTATPIPRTLTMSLYGDLDVSTIDEMPADRGRIVTAARDEEKLPDVLAFLRRELEAGRQAYIVYPLIDESEKLEAKAASAEFEKWQERLAPFTCELLHGRIPAPEKQAIMDRFRRGLTSVLVSTTVIEVGVDVANATVMLIENAERFGLAQLHQLRGRIGRGEHKSYCILLTLRSVGGDGGEARGPGENEQRFRSRGGRLGNARAGRSARDRAKRVARVEARQSARRCEIDAARAERPRSRSFGTTRSWPSRRINVSGLWLSKKRENLFPRQLMKNLFKFLLFVLVLSAGVSLLYDYQLRHGRLNLTERATPEKYTLAESPAVDPKAVASLASLSNERRKLVAGVIPSVVSVKTTKRIQRPQYGLDPFDFFRGNSRQFRGPAEEAMVQNSLGSGVIVTKEGHIITNNHVVDQVDEIEVQS